MTFSMQRFPAYTVGQAIESAANEAAGFDISKKDAREDSSFE